jgi:tRNA(Ile)-lysidine synthase
MIKTMRETIDRHHLIEKGDRIVVGLSGGPDSVAMFHALYQMKSLYQLDLVAVHLNHQIRGELADDDQGYVEELCREFDVKLYSFSEDIPGLSRELKLSEEEAGRKRRYELFEEVYALEKCQKIAVAQNMNDQVETFLMRVIRGASLQGLSAIRYRRDDRFIRPVLNCTRQSIEDYCEKNNLNPRIDHTNLETEYFRNRIRLMLIPLLKEEYNQNLIQTIARNVDLIQIDADCLQKQAEEVFCRLGIESPSLDEINQLHPAIRSRYLLKIVEIEAGNTRDVGSAQINQLIDMIEKGVEGKRTIVKGVVFRISQGKLSIGIAPRDEVLGFEEVLSWGVNTLELGGIRYRITVESVDEHYRSAEDSMTIYVDRDKLKGELKVRNRRPGDRFKPFGLGGHTKKLKDFMIDQKIQADERNRVLIIENEGDIVWVVGYRISEVYRMESCTERIAMLRIVKL